MQAHDVLKTVSFVRKVKKRIKDLGSKKSGCNTRCSRAVHKRY